MKCIYYIFVLLIIHIQSCTFTPRLNMDANFFTETIIFNSNGMDNSMKLDKMIIANSNLCFVSGTTTEQDINNKIISKSIIYSSVDSGTTWYPMLTSMDQMKLLYFDDKKMKLYIRKNIMNRSVYKVDSSILIELDYKTKKIQQLYSSSNNIVDGIIVNDTIYFVEIISRDNYFSNRIVSFDLNRRVYTRCYSSQKKLELRKSKNQGLLLEFDEKNTIEKLFCINNNEIHPLNIQIDNNRIIVNIVDFYQDLAIDGTPEFAAVINIGESDYKIELYSGQTIIDAFNINTLGYVPIEYRTNKDNILILAQEPGTSNFFPSFKLLKINLISKVMEEIRLANNKFLEPIALKNHYFLGYSGNGTFQRCHLN